MFLTFINYVISLFPKKITIQHKENDEQKIVVTSKSENVEQKSIVSTKNSCERSENHPVDTFAEELTISKWKTKYGQYLDQYIIKDVQTIVKEYLPKFDFDFNVYVSAYGYPLGKKIISSEMSCHDIYPWVRSENMFHFRCKNSLLQVYNSFWQEYTIHISLIDFQKPLYLLLNGKFTLLGVAIY